MTRINTCCPSDLSDQHLKAEYKELPRVFSMVLAAQERGETPSTYGIPSEFTLNDGHMKFFADKLGFLTIRYGALVEEMHRRGFTTNYPELREELMREIDDCWFHTWKPTSRDIAIGNQRILERIENSKKPHRWYGETL